MCDDGQMASVHVDLLSRNFFATNALRYLSSFDSYAQDWSTLHKNDELNSTISIGSFCICLQDVVIKTTDTVSLC